MQKWSKSKKGKVTMRKLSHIKNASSWQLTEFAPWYEFQPLMFELVKALTKEVEHINHEEELIRCS